MMTTPPSTARNMPFGTYFLNSRSLWCIVRQSMTLMTAQATPSTATRQSISGASAGAVTSKCVGAMLKRCVTP